MYTWICFKETKKIFTVDSPVMVDVPLGKSAKSPIKHTHFSMISGRGVDSPHGIWDNPSGTINERFMGHVQ